MAMANNELKLKEKLKPTFFTRLFDISKMLFKASNLTRGLFKIL